MNLLAVFCYVTVTCDWGAGPTAAAAQGPPDADGRNPRAPAADGRKTVRQTSSYPTRYDYINVETVLSNERILKVLFNCVINRGPCTREGLELKSKRATIFHVWVFLCPTGVCIFEKKKKQQNNITSYTTDLKFDTVPVAKS